MTPLTQYGLLAEKHWRTWLPRMVAELERTGRLHEMLLEAEEKTEADLDSLRRHFIQQGLTARPLPHGKKKLCRGPQTSLYPRQRRSTNATSFARSARCARIGAPDPGAPIHRPGAKHRLTI